MVGKIHVAVCTRRDLKPEWCLTFGSVLRQAFYLAGLGNVRWGFNFCFPLDYARNMCVKEALEWNADYILFLDDDVLPPDDGLLTLFLDAVPIVSGLYFSRYPPHNPVIFRRKNRNEPWSLDAETEWDAEFTRSYPKNQLVEADVAGLGFMLVMREVFEKIPEPWFKSTLQHGEDVYFCWKAQQHGFKVFVDTRVKCLHMADLFVGEKSALRELSKKQRFYSSLVKLFQNEASNVLENLN
ncbi:MAG: hypothetical protein QXH20_06355 [Candidatus Bathyarchaeia archaeon]